MPSGQVGSAGDGTPGKLKHIAQPAAKELFKESQVQLKWRSVQRTVSRAHTGSAGSSLCKSGVMTFAIPSK